MSAVPFDPEAVRALATILADTGLTEIEIVEGDRRIRVVRAAPVGAPVAYAAPPPAATVHVSATAAPTSAPAVAADLSQHPGAVLSPMVGIVYLSPEPGAAPFVAVGQPVTAGQTVLLIEAMKTFNQIKAPRDGTVTRVLVSAGAPVEYGEPLLVIE